MVRVAVTGAGTPLGKAVLQHLHTEKTVTAIVDVDLAKPDISVTRLDFHPADVRDPLLPVILDGSGVVVHCVLESLPDRNEDTAFARTVHGSRNLLDAVTKVGAQKLIVVSGAVVYGAHPDNELVLTEDTALRANPDFAAAYQLMLVEQLVAEWADEHPAVSVTVLRPAIMLGPNVNGFMARHLQFPRLPLIRGQSAPLQFVHVDDIAAAVGLAVTTDLPGAFNVAADGWLPVAEVCALLGRRPIALPEAVAFEAVRWLWDRRLWHMPSGALYYLMYPCVVTAERLQAHGWTPSWSNREILREFAAAHHGYLAIGRLRVRRRNLYICVCSTVGLFVLMAWCSLNAWRKRS